MAMVTAVETRPGTNPDRASFTTALETARDQLTAARGICPDCPADLPGVIGRAVLATLLPAQRPRFSARKVKFATSRYLEHPEFGGDSILPRCSGLGGRCLPRYRRLAEPRSDHFSAFVLSNICPAALSSC